MSLSNIILVSVGLSIIYIMVGQMVEWILSRITSSRAYCIRCTTIDHLVDNDVEEFFNANRKILNIFSLFSWPLCLIFLIGSYIGGKMFDNKTKDDRNMFLASHFG